MQLYGSIFQFSDVDIVCLIWVSGMTSCDSEDSNVKESVLMDMCQMDMSEVIVGP